MKTKCSFAIKHNGLVYGSLAISRYFRIKLQVKFNKSTKLSHTTAPPMNYIPCWQP